MTKPISPIEVDDLKAESIPDQVFEAFNELIAKRWDGNRSVVKQEEVVTAILSRMSETTRSELFENDWLDVEGAYRKAGWIVDYDKPGYCETYPATFTFKKRASR